MRRMEVEEEEGKTVYITDIVEVKTKRQNFFLIIENDHSKLRILVYSCPENQRICPLVVTAKVADKNREPTSLFYPLFFSCHLFTSPLIPFLFPFIFRPCSHCQPPSFLCHIRNQSSRYPLRSIGTTACGKRVSLTLIVPFSPHIDCSSFLCILIAPLSYAANGPLFLLSTPSCVLILIFNPFLFVVIFCIFYRRDRLEGVEGRDLHRSHCEAAGGHSTDGGPGGCRRAKDVST